MGDVKLLQSIIPGLNLKKKEKTGCEGEGGFTQEDLHTKVVSPICGIKSWVLG